MTCGSPSSVQTGSPARRATLAAGFAVLVLAGVTTLFAAEIPADHSPEEGTFELIIEGDSVALHSNGGSLVEILEAIGEKQEIEIVAALPSPVTVDSTYPPIPLETLIERFSHHVDIAYVVGSSQTEDRKITKIMVFPRGGGRGRAEPAPLSGAKQPARRGVSFEPMQHLR